YHNKIEEKIPTNYGRQFYERGVWCTLNGLKIKFDEAKSIIPSIHLTQQLIDSELNFFSNKIALLEKIETTIVAYLSIKSDIINSMANSEILEFDLMTNF